MGSCSEELDGGRLPYEVLASCHVLRVVCLLLTLRITWHLLLKPVVGIPLGHVPRGQVIFPCRICWMSLLVSVKHDCASHLVSNLSNQGVAMVIGLICPCQDDLLFRSRQISANFYLLMAYGGSWVTTPRAKRTSDGLSWQFWSRSGLLDFVILKPHPFFVLTL